MNDKQILLRGLTPPYRAPGIAMTDLGFNWLVYLGLLAGG